MDDIDLKARKLEYTLCMDREGHPLVVLESPLGNGQEITTASLRRLATSLQAIADEADHFKGQPLSVNSHRSVQF